MHLYVCGKCECNLESCLPFSVLKIVKTCCNLSTKVGAVWQKETCPILNYIHHCYCCYHS